MLRVYGVLGVLGFVLWLYCVIDVLTSEEGEIRHLPTLPWLLLVLFFPFVGSVAWLVAGRPPRGPRRSSPHRRSAPQYPEYDRPGRIAAADPAEDEEFLRQVRERAEEQRRRHEQQRREREREAEYERERRPPSDPE